MGRLNSGKSQTVSWLHLPKVLRLVYPLGEAFPFNFLNQLLVNRCKPIPASRLTAFQEVRYKESKLCQQKWQDFSYQEFAKGRRSSPWWHAQQEAPQPVRHNLGYCNSFWWEDQAVARTLLHQLKIKYR
jgi:hypothetical protein